MFNIHKNVIAAALIASVVCASPILAARADDGAMTSDNKMMKHDDKMMQDKKMEKKDAMKSDDKMMMKKDDKMSNDKMSNDKMMKQDSMSK